MKHPELAVELARALAAFAHAGQTDKAGQPYLTHPVAVAGKVRTPEEKITALLHDVLEDTFVLPETIGNLFGAEILAAVQAVTKREDEDYMDFVARAKRNPIARAVKLADLEHNMDLSRIPNPTEKDLARAEKYRRAKAFLAED
jgi:(p)ppGpp synthase/HD superfamily hydrolase